MCARARVCVCVCGRVRRELGRRGHDGKVRNYKKNKNGRVSSWLSSLQVLTNYTQEHACQPRLTQLPRG